GGAMHADRSARGDGEAPRRIPLATRGELERARHRRARVDPAALVDGREQVGAARDALAAPEDQEAGLREAVVQRPEAARLQAGIEVEEHVPAAREIEPRERRVAREVVLHEDAEVADELLDPIRAAFDAREVLAEPRLVHVAERVLRVD